MSWLRIDDGFARHPKIEQLSDREFRTWIGVLCYCAEYRNGGLIYKQAISRSVRGATPAFLQRCVSIGLLDPTTAGNELQQDVHFQIHDFDEYNGVKDPQAAERMRRYRQEHPRVSGGKWERTREAIYERDGGICADCGQYTDDWNADHEPDRGELTRRGISIYDLAHIFTRCHSCHAKKTRRQANGRTTSTEPPSEPTISGSPPVHPPHAQARAPVPSPTPNTSNPVTATQNVARETDQPGHGHGELRTDQELEALAASILHDMPA